MNIACFDIYQKQVQKKYKKLTREDEVELFIRYHNCDPKAHRQIIESNLPFALTIAMQYQGQGICKEDLVGAANMGLLKAIDRFDPYKGFKFISYAVWWIRQAILKEIKDHGRIVKIPDFKAELVLQVRKAAGNLMSKLHREPTMLEIADQIGETVERVEYALSVKDDHQSTDEAMFDNDKSSIVEYIAAESEEMPDPYLREYLTETFNELSERERSVVRDRFGFNKEQYQYTLDYVADKFKVSRERARQIEKIVIRKLSQKLAPVRSYLYE